MSVAGDAAGDITITPATVNLGVFIVGEVTVAVLAHSLALLSDAGHMLTDVAALGVSLVALRLAQRPPKGGLTFGLKRAEVLAALISGATLLVLAAVLIFEAVLRFAAPPPVQGAAVFLGQDGSSPAGTSERAGS